MIKRTGYYTGVMFSLAGGLSVLAAEDPEAIEGLVRDAYANSPDLQAAYARWQGALEGVPQAGSLPDPRVGYGYFIEQMDTRQRFWVEQAFPGFGKRGLRAGVSAEASRVAADGLEAVAADIRMRMLGAVADWVLVTRSADLVEENLHLVEQLEQVALQRYRAAEASQADVLRLQMEVDALKVDLESWQQRKPAVQARLNAVRGRPPEYPVPAIGGLPGLEPISGSGPGGEFFSLTGNPDLRQSQSRIRQAEQARTLSRRESLPDVTVGLEYMENRAGAPNELMAMVSINIPVWQGRYRAMRREANANLRAAEADYDALYQKLQAEARMARYEEQDAARRVRLFQESLLPKARQSLAILESGYKTGSSGFLDLLESQRTVLELELALARAETEYFIRRAEWQRLTGPYLSDVAQSVQTLDKQSDE